MPTSSPTTVRFTEADKRLIADLSDKLGLELSSVLRLALRRLHDVECCPEKKQRKSRRTA